ncbi:MAG: CoA pyrophosphatase [Saccharospirillum sp.]
MTSYSSFFSQIERRLTSHEPRLLSLNQPRAGVLVPLVVSAGEPSLLLTVRAQHLNSHPGDIAFPGGMWEPEDVSLQATALRETHEELNLSPDLIEVLGPLSTGLSKSGVQVFPFVGKVASLDQCVASPDEIAEWFTVPWAFFTDTAPRLQPIERHGISFQIPHYDFDGHHIWGLTAMILLELVNLTEGTDWPLPAFTGVTRPGRL